MISFEELGRVYKRMYTTEWRKSLTGVKYIALGNGFYEVYVDKPNTLTGVYNNEDWGELGY